MKYFGPPKIIMIDFLITYPCIQTKRHCQYEKKEMIKS